MSDKSSSLKRLYPWIGVTVFGLAAFLIYRALRGHSLEEIVQSLGAISSTHLALGAAFTAGSYLCLTANDTLAIRYTKGDLPYRRIALASLISLSIGHTLGLAAFSSGAVRYRFYTAWGLSAGDVGRIILFCGATVLVGLTTLGAIAALTQPPLVARMIGVGSGLVIAVGVVLLVLLAAYLALTTFVRRPIRIRTFTLPLPPLTLAIGQILVGTCDFLLVSAVLHQMLSASADIGFFPVAAVYVMANTAAIVSHVPGGLGVIEAVILSLVPGANVIGALIAFRTIYFLIPFVIGSLMLGAFELAHRRHRASPG
jgi:glycosyltransferase 2 family protein